MSRAFIGCQLPLEQSREKKHAPQRQTQNSVDTANVVTKHGCTHSFQIYEQLSWIRPAQLMSTSTPPTQLEAKL